MSVTVRLHLRPTCPAAPHSQFISQLHTDLGDLKIEVFCESVPKTAEVRPLHFPPGRIDTSLPLKPSTNQKQLELPSTMRLILLHRRLLPPLDPRLHDPDRGPKRQRQRRGLDLARRLRGRDPGCAAP